MAETIGPSAVLDAALVAEGLHGTVPIAVRPPTAQFVFRGAGDAVARAGAAFGVALPETPCRAAGAGGRFALWLGPDEWLLLAPDGEAATVARDMAAALAGAPHALVAVGHRATALSLEGESAARVLNAGCPLDLATAAFPVGMCTRTVLAKAEIVLWRTGAHAFAVFVARSFVPYAWAFLLQARGNM